MSTTASCVYSLDFGFSGVYKGKGKGEGKGKGKEKGKGKGR